MGREIKINRTKEELSLRPQVHHPEVLLISSVLNSQESSKALTVVSSEWFNMYRPEWEWIESFQNKYGNTPDPESFLSTFQAFPLQSTKDVDWGIEEVRINYIRRRLIGSVNGIMERIEGGSISEAVEMMSESSSEMARVSENIRPLTLNDTDEFYEEVKRRIETAQETGMSGIRSGWPTLDEQTGGWQPGDLGIIAARLGQGKTWFLTRMAAEALLCDKNVLFISLEQPAMQVHFRIQTILAKFMGHQISNRSLISGKNVDLKAYGNFLREVAGKFTANLRVVDPRRGRVSPATVGGLIDRYKPDIVFIDYITLMSVPGGGSNTDDWIGIGKISKETKLVALTYNVPVVCAAQINRGGVQETDSAPPPGVDKLARADSIGQDADVVVTLQKFGRDARKALLAKVRSGQDGNQFYTSFLPDRGQIEEVTMKEAQELFSNSMVDSDG